MSVWGQKGIPCLGRSLRREGEGGRAATATKCPHFALPAHFARPAHLPPLACFRLSQDQVIPIQRVCAPWHRSRPHGAEVLGRLQPLTCGPEEDLVAVHAVGLARLRGCTLDRWLGDLDGIP